MSRSSTYRHGVTGTVIALAVAVTLPAMADTAPAVAPPKAPVVSPPAAPQAPAAAAPAQPKAPTIAAPATPAVAAPSAPKVAPIVAAAPTPAPAKEAAPAAKEAAPVASEPAAAAAPAAEPEPTLPLRPAKALPLAAEPASTPWPYKLLFGVVIVGAGVLVWRRRKALAIGVAKPTAVKVLAKTATGLRGELALVEVGGMRLLVGITPSSMQTLAILPDDASEAIDEAALQATDPAPRESVRANGRTSVPAAARDQGLQLVSRARSLFSSIDVGPPVPPRASSATFAASRYADERDDVTPPESAPEPPKERESRAPRRRSRELPLEGQARGLALSLGNNKK